MNFNKLRRWLAQAGVVLVSALLASCHTMQPQQLPQPQQPQPQQNTQAAPPPAPAQIDRASQYLPVDFYLAQQKSANGLVRLKLGKNEVWVAPQPVMTRADLASVQPRRGAKGQPFVRFTFSSEGARKFEQITTRYHGKIMVISIGKTVIDVLLLDAVVTNGTLDVMTRTDQEAINVSNAVSRPTS